ncbi:MAG: phosphoadenylyl-sulfate reductase [Terriglobales bacterium]
MSASENTTTAQELVLHFANNQHKSCITCSFQAEDMVVLDLLRKVQPGVPVLFLDTGYHFAETYAYRDRMVVEWGLNLINLSAAASVAGQEAAHGKLYQTAPDRCCHLRKVEPLLRGLEDFDVWFTGLRREQSPTRANLAPVEPHALANGKKITKVNPLALWTWKDVWRYLDDQQIPVLSLYNLGYSSIGCEPCTSLPINPGDPRSGRWAGRKLECGIHTFSEGK